MKRVEDKIILVTGAASRPGIGSTTAEILAREGGVLILTDIDGEGAEETAAAIRSAGGRATAMSHDVTSEADWSRVISAIIASHGRIDGLVNNAGIAILRMIEQLTPQLWSKQIETNLTSVYLGTSLAVAEMRKTGGGSIVNLSSVVGNVGVPGCAAYGASKGGIRLFTKSIALETARQHIRLNSVHPGMILTNMQGVAEEDNRDQYDAICAAIPMGYMGDPADIAHCILYLISDESRYVTGAEFTIDGGLTAQ